MWYNQLMKNKILIIGNGAKEYALAKKLYETNNEIFITPSSDSLKEFAHCLDIREDNIQELLDFALEQDIDLTIPISETSINSDIVSLFSKNNLAVFAPSKDSVKLIFDKALAKKILYKLRIPTPKFGIFEKQNMAYDYIKNLSTPFVLKTNDSKSAAIFTSYQTAKKTIDLNSFEKGKKIIIEDYIYGTPFSFYTITDGYKALPIGSSITYKHSLEGDGGQLTSGMGACAPNYKLSIDQVYYLMDNVIYPTLDYFEIEGNPYLGILGVNGILTDDGRIFILGWHSFMQDCDAAAVLEVLGEDLPKLFKSCIIGSFSDEIDSICFNKQYSSSLVLTCKNKINTENSIQGLDNLESDTVLSFYPTVRKNKYLEYEADYGPALVLTASAATTSRAVNKMYDEATSIDFKGLYYRKDICSFKY